MARHHQQLLRNSLSALGRLSRLLTVGCCWWCDGGSDCDRVACTGPGDALDGTSDGCSGPFDVLDGIGDGFAGPGDALDGTSDGRSGPGDAFHGTGDGFSGPCDAIDGISDGCDGPGDVLDVTGYGFTGLGDVIDRTGAGSYLTSPSSVAVSTFDNLGAGDGVSLPHAAGNNPAKASRGCAPT